MSLSKSPRKMWPFGKKGKSRSNSPPEHLCDDMLETGSESISTVGSNASLSTPPSYQDRFNCPSTPKDWEKEMIDAANWKGTTQIGRPLASHLTHKPKAQDPILRENLSKSENTVHGGKLFKETIFRRRSSKNHTSTRHTSRSYNQKSDLDERTPGRSKSHGSLDKSLGDSIHIDNSRHQTPIAKDTAINGGSLFAGKGALLAPGGGVLNINAPNQRLLSKEEVEREKKLRFTYIHNDNACDTAAPYLGEDKSVQHGQNFYFFDSSSREGSPTGPRPIALAPVKESELDASRKRVLEPMQGTQSWSSDLEYLFIPAIITTCPSTAYKRLNSMDDSIHYGNIVLGKATHVGFKTASQFVLKKNYLFEIEDATFRIEKSSRPCGFAFLQNSTVQIIDDTISLKYFMNSQRNKQKTIQLKVEPNTDAERKRWVQCLDRASKLRIEDMYTYDGQELGKGRYVTVLSANRVQSLPNLSGLNHGQEQKNGIMKKNPSFSSLSNGLNNLKIGQRSRRALKIVDKRNFYERVRKGKERLDTIVREISVQVALMTELESRYFLQIYGIFETFDEFVIELEMIEGNDIFAHMKMMGSMREDLSARIMHDVLVGIKAMRNGGIAHRDLKLRNIMLTNRFGDKDEDGVVAKLVDFGMATFKSKDGLIRGRCGTPGFVAPEICNAGVNDGYKNDVDIFSAGVVLYILLCGYEPFYGKDETELINANKKGKVKYDLKDWASVSVDGQDLVKKMLEPDPNKRILPRDALNHPWIKRRVETRTF